MTNDEAALVLLTKYNEQTPFTSGSVQQFLNKMSLPQKLAWLVMGAEYARVVNALEYQIGNPPTAEQTESDPQRLLDTVIDEVSKKGDLYNTISLKAQLLKADLHNTSKLESCLLKLPTKPDESQTQ